MPRGARAVFIALAAASAGRAQGSDGGATLRELADRRDFLIGAAASPDTIRLDARYGELLAEQFNALTPENAMKFDRVHPRAGLGADSYDFAEPDELVSFAESRGMRVRGHALVWHRALPSWLDGAQDRNEILRGHIQTVASRYKGRVYAWDVVNEAIADDGSLRETPWSALGPGYIADAFRWAHEADPEAKLFYNDYDAELNPAKADAIYALISSLLAENVPVHGVGFQLHLAVGRSYSDFAALFRRFAALGVEVNVTELDVSIVDFGGPPGAEKLSAQAELYGRVLRGCREEPNCRAVTAWGFTDRYSWLSFFSPLIFDKEYKPKPAFDAVRAALN